MLSPSGCPPPVACLPTLIQLSAWWDMQALLTATVVWLSTNFDLPPVYEHPRIERASSTEMMNLYHQGFLGDPSRGISVTENQDRSEYRRPVVSLYHVATKTIYLSNEWTGRTPAELSILVHEMVHHLQHLTHTSYACPQARERLAYDAQDKWLSVFGRSLLSEFKLDRFTVILTTMCMEPE